MSVARKLHHQNHMADKGANVRHDIQSGELTDATKPEKRKGIVQ